MANPATRTWLARTSIAALSAAALIIPAVSANAANTSATATASAATVHADIMSGRARAKYGVNKVCATHKLRCGAQVLTTASNSATPMVTDGPTGYGPADFDAAYHISGSGSGTIAILDAGADPNLEADLGAYRKQYKLPDCTSANGCLKIEGYDGGAPQKPQTSSDGKQIEEEVATETSLDVDAASAACPACKIVELQLPYQDATGSNEATAMKDFGTAVNTAVSGGANSVSISYGFTGNDDSLTGATAKAFDHPGTAIEVSAGDSGFQGGGTHASWPAALPTVNSVGGTTLNKSGSGFNETVWNEKDSQHGATGSGCETAVSPAIGQPNSVSANCGGHRPDNDISADADPVTGYSVYDTYTPSSGSGGGWQTVGGTSASSPLIAGYYARAGVSKDVHGPNKLYAAAASNFTDVTSGNDEYTDDCASANTKPIICTAGTGWDGPTGLGTPNGLGAF